MGEVVGYAPFFLSLFLCNQNTNKCHDPNSSDYDPSLDKNNPYRGAIPGTVVPHGQIAEADYLRTYLGAIPGTVVPHSQIAEADYLRTYLGAIPGTVVPNSQFAEAGYLRTLKTQCNTL